MANTDVIGVIPCGECGAEAEVKRSKRLRPYYTCDNCGSQHFSRGPESERLMLSRMKRLEQPTEQVPAEDDGDDWYKI